MEIIPATIGIYVSAIFNFIAANPISAAAISLLIFIYLMQEQGKRFIAVSDIRKVYINRSLSHLEEILETIVSTSYNSMLENTKDIQLKCPNGTKGCRFTNNEMWQQLLLYKLQLRDTFFIYCKNKVKNSILKNGFHEYDIVQLNSYYERKGLKLYNDVVDILKEHLRNVAPDLYPLIGSNFSSEDAIKMYKIVIEKCLLDEKHRDAQIKKYKDDHNIFYKVIKFKKTTQEFIE